MTLGQILIFSVSVFLLLLYVFLNWFIHILAILYGRNKLHKAPPPLCSEDIQGVSIIKPLVGVDPNLYHNLETFFYLDYPTYELLFSVHDEHDPAIMVVEKLIEKHPRVDAKLFKGIKYVGPNGKVNNMVKPFQASRYDLIVISDSSIKASPELLKDMVGHMTPRIGLVIQMPFVCDRKGFSGVLEKVFFGTMQARNALAANAVGVNCSSGSNSLVRKEILEAAGGISAFGKYLAEDHFIAIETTKQGYGTTLSNMCAMQNSGTYSVELLHRRLIRWSKLRISTVPLLIIMEPISESMVQGILISWIVEYLFGISSLGFFLLHLLVWFLSDYTLLRIVQNGPLPFNKFEFFSAWMFRECFSFYLSLKSLLGSRTVAWGPMNYRLHWGGTIQEIKQNRNIRFNIF